MGKNKKPTEETTTTSGASSSSSSSSASTATSSNRRWNFDLNSHQSIPEPFGYSARVSNEERKGQSKTELRALQEKVLISC